MEPVPRQAVLLFELGYTQLRKRRYLTIEDVFLNHVLLICGLQVFDYLLLEVRPLEVLLKFFDLLENQFRHIALLQWLRVRDRADLVLASLLQELDLRLELLDVDVVLVDEGEDLAREVAEEGQVVLRGAVAVDYLDYVVKVMRLE